MKTSINHEYIYQQRIKNCKHSEHTSKLTYNKKKKIWKTIRKEDSNDYISPSF